MSGRHAHTLDSSLLISPIIGRLSHHSSSIPIWGAWRHSSAGKVFVSFWSRQLQCTWADSLLPDVKLDLEWAVLVAGKFALRRRWSWKIASCLPMPAQDLFERPLRTFANRMWCEAGNLHVHDVQDGLDCGKQLLAGSSTIAEAKNDFTFFNHTLLITILTPPSRDGYWYLRMNDSKVWSEVDRIFVEDCSNLTSARWPPNS